MTGRYATPRRVAIDRIVVHGGSVDRHALAGLPQLIAAAIRSPQASPRTDPGGSHTVETIAAAVARRVAGEQAQGGQGAST